MRREICAAGGSRGGLRGVRRRGTDDRRSRSCHVRAVRPRVPVGDARGRPKAAPIAAAAGLKNRSADFSRRSLIATPKHVLTTNTHQTHTQPPMAAMPAHVSAAVTYTATTPRPDGRKPARVAGSLVPHRRAPHHRWATVRQQKRGGRLNNNAALAEDAPASDAKHDTGPLSGTETLTLAVFSTSSLHAPHADQRAE